jgi:hypothetical protein
MQELLVDFITSLTATGPRRAGPDGGDWKDPSISPGSASSQNATTRS